ncbi:MAG: T9SS type A sorting domain-containing protein [Bacteroidetes bacterium]|nr:T9SS type A sorting domain-containing protein [Bacteroidota bacterium]
MKKNYLSLSYFFLPLRFHSYLPVYMFLAAVFAYVPKINAATVTYAVDGWTTYVFTSTGTDATGRNQFTTTYGTLQWDNIDKEWEMVLHGGTLALTHSTPTTPNPPCKDVALGWMNNTYSVGSSSGDCQAAPPAQTSFYTVTFEDGDPNAGTYTADVDNICTSQRYFARVADTDISTNSANDYIGEIGSKYWAGEAHDDVPNSGICTNGAGEHSKTIVFGPISIAGKSNLALSVWVASNSTATNRFECDDLISFTYSIDGGGPQTALSFRADQPCADNGSVEELRQDKDLDGVGDALEPALGQTFQQFQTAIAGTGNNITITLTMDNDALSEEMAIDQLELLEDFVLPVELIDFKAVRRDNTIVLDWQTASELNNEGFELQKSIDARNWETLNFIPGNGTTFEPHKYEYMDSRPYNGINYYRLRQIDFDGHYEYSKIVSAVFRGDNDPSDGIKVFPNPVKHGSLAVYLPSRQTEGATLRLFDVSGKLLKQKNADGNSAKLDVQDVPAGMYWLEVSAAGARWMEKVVMSH